MLFAVLRLGAVALEEEATPRYEEHDEVLIPFGVGDLLLVATENRHRHGCTFFFCHKCTLLLTYI